MSGDLSISRHFGADAPRVDTFGSSRSEPEDHHQLIVIFIPGFKERMHALQTVIAQWRKTGPFQRGTAYLKLFRCDLLNGARSVKAFELEYWTSKVAEYMSRHEMTSSHPRRGSLEGRTSTDLMDSPGDSSSFKPRKFVLIGHSLGCWIMRDLIVRYASQSIVMNTVALYSLDAISLDIFKPDQSPNLGVYTEYITAINDRFNLRIHSNADRAIEQNLRTLDLNFLSMIQNIQTANSEPSLINESLEVWLRGPTNVTQAKRKPGGRLKAAVNQLWRHPKDISGNRDSLAILQAKLIVLLSNLQNHMDAGAMHQGPEHVKRSSPDHLDRISRRDQVIQRQLYGSISGGGLGTVDKSSSESSKHNPGMVSDPYSYQTVQDWSEVVSACIDSGHLNRANQLLNENPENILLSPRGGRWEGNDLLRLRDEISLYRALVQMHLGHYGLAIQEFHSMMTKHPDLERDARRFLGVSYLLCGDYNAAIDILGGLLGHNDLSSDKEVIRYNSRIQRDLAIAYAYLGHMDHSREFLDDARRAVERRPSFELQRRPEQAGSSIYSRDTSTDFSDTLDFTEATIDLIQGNYQNALGNIKNAYKGMDQHLGKNHFKTLESAKLQALLLALNSEILEAELVCRDAIKTMRTELGDLHPSTLETQFVLVYIFRTQSRFREAITIGASVLNSMRDIDQNEHHLRTLDARAELAMNYRLVGNYRDAVTELETVIRQSKFRYGLTHQSTLRYLSELAHVYLCCGYMEFAEHIAVEVLQRQKDLYSVSPRNSGMKLAEESQLQGLRRSATMAPEPKLVQLSADKASRQVQYKSIVVAILKEILPEDDMGHLVKQIEILGYGDRNTEGQISGDHPSSALHKQQSRLHVHPFLVHTLEVLSSLIFQMDPSNAPFTMVILEVVVLWKKKRLGPRNVSTLNSMYGLAKVKRELYPNDLGVALEGFRDVYDNRCQLLGARNPESLAAKRELLITICASESFGKDYIITDELDIMPSNEVKSRKGEDPIAMTWNEIESCSQEILLLHEESLGKYHPETLNTLLWVLVVQLEADRQQPGVDKTADDTAAEALGRLRSRTVREQRLREAFSMEERIACFFDEYDRHELAKDVRDGITREARNADTDLLSLTAFLHFL